ncbi:hypothetical protein [Ensifer sp. SSB1]|uniref:hypothetical protein n=1 Tax=Ensifer sp. SSB1 TaxID=2795385 RepID=UPI001A4283EF|nr:hypothetical protein [Ensifer sp. SSB1]MBK5568153.1 hypothetical protein [Ensifer sp. SSB1]
MPIDQLAQAGMQPPVVAAIIVLQHIQIELRYGAKFAGVAWDTLLNLDERLLHGPFERAEPFRFIFVNQPKQLALRRFELCDEVRDLRVAILIRSMHFINLARTNEQSQLPHLTTVILIRISKLFRNEAPNSVTF